MAPISLAFVVSFTSQDDNFPAENLLYGSRRWQSSPTLKIATTEVELQFANSSKISHIDIGNYGSANIRIQVGRSSWPRDHEFVTFLPTVFLMTPSESRQNVNRSTVRMFGAEHFDEKSRTELWDRVRILCHQPYRVDVPFGLSFIKFHAVVDDVNGNGFDGAQNGDEVVKAEAQFFNRLRNVKNEPETAEQPVLSRSARLVLVNSPVCEVVFVGSRAGAIRCRSNEMPVVRLSSVSSLQNLDRNREIGNCNYTQTPETPTNTRRKLKSTRKRSSSAEESYTNSPKKQDRKDIFEQTNNPITDLIFDQAGPSSGLMTQDQILNWDDGDYIPCPICTEIVQKDEIQWHVNNCLDHSL